MSVTSLSAVRLAEAEVCLSRIPVGCLSGGGCGVSLTDPCRLSVWWRLRCVCHVTVGCPSVGG